MISPRISSGGVIASIVLSGCILLGTISFCILASSGGDPLDGYCYGVVDKNGTTHPSAEAPYMSEVGVITKIPGEQVHMIQAPVAIIIDTRCVCEENLEDLPIEECERADD